MSRQLTTRQKELFTGIAILVLGAVALIAGELLVSAMRLVTFRVGPDGEAENTYFHEATGLRLPLPGAMFGKIQINSLGFRGPEPEALRDDGAIRIAFLGSSTTFDPYAFPDHKSWPALTSEKLGEVYPGCRFTYQNTGFPGLGIYHLEAFYAHLVASFPADIVVVMTDDRLAIFEQLAKGDEALQRRLYRPSSLAKYSLIWASVERKFVIEWRKRLIHWDAGELVFTRAQLVTGYGKKLTRLLTGIRARGAVPVLLSFGQKLRKNQTPVKQVGTLGEDLLRLPYVSVDGFLRSADWYNEMNSDIAATMQVPYLEWHERIPGQDRYFIDSRHFTPEGSALLADVLVDEMQNSRAFSTELAEKFDCVHGAGNLDQAIGPTENRSGYRHYDKSVVGNA